MYLSVARSRAPPDKIRLNPASSNAASCSPEHIGEGYSGVVSRAALSLSPLSYPHFFSRWHELAPLPPRPSLLVLLPPHSNQIATTFRLRPPMEVGDPKSNFPMYARSRLCCYSLDRPTRAIVPTSKPQTRARPISYIRTCSSETDTQLWNGRRGLEELELQASRALLQLIQSNRRKLDKCALAYQIKCGKKLGLGRMDGSRAILELRPHLVLDGVF